MNEYGYTPVIWVSLVLSFYVDHEYTEISGIRPRNREKSDFSEFYSSYSGFALFFLAKNWILLPSDFIYFMSNILWLIHHKKGDTLFISFKEKNSLKASPGGGREHI